MNLILESVQNSITYILLKMTKKTQDGMVEPGIGGDVYTRLGFSGQNAKNKYVPNIVKERRVK